MHDPMTVAHEIKYPWWESKPWPNKYRKDRESSMRKYNFERMMKECPDERYSSMWPEGYRSDFITIWHVDPERDGTDDSCGYSYVRLNPKQKETLRNTAWWEGKAPHFLICREKDWTGNVSDAESLYRGLAALVDRVLRLNLPYSKLCAYATEAVHIRCSTGKYGSAFCFLPGYHTNSEKDSEREREDHFYGILCNVASSLLTDLRPWYRHPKWHFWHWQFQVHPLLAFKRWAFSRCCKCGKRFEYGYCPVSGNWNGTGPLWFRSEQGVMHSDCSNVTVDATANKEAEPT